MAGVNVTAVFEDDEVQRALRQLYEEVRDLRPLFKDIGEYMLQSVEQRFHEEVDPDGNPWEPLAASTRRRKKHTKILTESHELRLDQVYQIRGDELEQGTSRIYGAIHQLGGRAGLNLAALIDPRPFIGIGAHDELEISDIAMDHMAEAARR